MNCDCGSLAHSDNKNSNFLFYKLDNFGNNKTLVENLTNEAFSFHMRVLLFLFKKHKGQLKTNYLNDYNLEHTKLPNIPQTFRILNVFEDLREMFVPSNESMVYEDEFSQLDLEIQSCLKEEKGDYVGLQFECNEEIQRPEFYLFYQNFPSQVLSDFLDSRLFEAFYFLQPANDSKSLKKKIVVDLNYRDPNYYQRQKQKLEIKIDEKKDQENQKQIKTKKKKTKKQRNSFLPAVINQNTIVSEETQVHNACLRIIESERWDFGQNTQEFSELMGSEITKLRLNSTLEKWNQSFSNNSNPDEFPEKKEEKCWFENLEHDFIGYENKDFVSLKFNEVDKLVLLTGPSKTDVPMDRLNLSIFGDLNSVDNLSSGINLDRQIVPPVEVKLDCLLNQNKMIYDLTCGQNRQKTPEMNKSGTQSKKHKAEDKHSLFLFNNYETASVSSLMTVKNNELVYSHKNMVHLMLKSFQEKAEYDFIQRLINLVLQEKTSRFPELPRDIPHLEFISYDQKNRLFQRAIKLKEEVIVKDVEVESEENKPEKTKRKKKKKKKTDLVSVLPVEEILENQQDSVKKALLVQMQRNLQKTAEKVNEKDFAGIYESELKRNGRRIIQ